jgi:hypothetical protein
MRGDGEGARFHAIRRAYARYRFALALGGVPFPDCNAMTIKHTEFRSADSNTNAMASIYTSNTQP